MNVNELRELIRLIEDKHVAINRDCLIPDSWRRLQVCTKHVAEIHSAALKALRKLENANL